MYSNILCRLREIICYTPLSLCMVYPSLRDCSQILSKPIIQISYSKIKIAYQSKNPYCCLVSIFQIVWLYLHGNWDPLNRILSEFTGSDLGAIVESSVQSSCLERPCAHQAQDRCRDNAILHVIGRLGSVF
jgi:hypothetical protein